MLFVNMLSIPIVFATTEETPTSEEMPPQTETSQTPTETPAENTTSLVAQATAIVIEVGQIKELQTDHVTSKTQEIKVEILDGQYEAREFTTDYLFSYDSEGKNHNYELEVGDKVKVQITQDANGNITATVQNIVRNTYIIMMIGIFLLAFGLIMGKRAIKPILNLVIIFLAIYFILVKGIYAGYSAILLTMATAIVILFINSMITVGFNKKAMVVILGTFSSIFISTIIAVIFSHLSKLSGIREDSIAIQLNTETINFYFKDLIFAGIVIASLGICMNMAISLVSQMDEVKDRTEDMPWEKLFKIGMERGNSLIGKMLNTIVLIYISCNLTIFFIFLATHIGIGEIINKETIAENAISAIAGSIGIIISVPITAFIYARLNRKKTIYKTTSENKVEGNRSLKL